MADDETYAPITIEDDRGGTTVFDPTDLTSPKNDTYVLAQQWLYADAHEAERADVFEKEVQLGERDVWEGAEQIPSLVAEVIVYGRHYPVDRGYRHFTAEQLKRAAKLGNDPDLGLNRRWKAALAKAVEEGDPR